MTTSDPFAELPIVIHKKHDRSFWRAAQVAVLGIWVVVIGVYGIEVYEDRFLVACGLGVGLIVLLEFLMRLRGRFVGATVAYTMDAMGVQYSTGKEPWFESLGAYEGVLWREEIRRTTGKNSRDVRFRIVELKHRSNPKRTVPLLEQTIDGGGTAGR